MQYVYIYKCIHINVELKTLSQSYTNTYIRSYTYILTTYTYENDTYYINT